MGRPADSTIDPAAILRQMRSFISIASAEPASQAVWEEAGQDLWDVTALEHPATVLYDAGAVEMLSAVTSATAGGTWRAAELAVGILGNMACHALLRAKFLLDPGLAELTAGLALPSENAATAGEACRLCATVLCGSTGSDPWYEDLSSPDALKALVWIIDNAAGAEVVAQALGVVAALLGAAEEPPPALAEQLVELRIVSMALSAVRARLKELDDDEEEEEGQQQGLEGERRPEGHTLASPASHEVVLEALAVLYQLVGTKAGAEALGREADAAEVSVRLAAAEGPDSDVAAPSIFLLAQIEDKQVGALLSQEPGAVGVVLAALRGACPAGADAQDALRAAALHLLALMLRYLNGTSKEEWKGLRGVALAVMGGAEGLLLPGDDSPTASYCRRSIEALRKRLNE